MHFCSASTICRLGRYVLLVAGLASCTEVRALEPNRAILQFGRRVWQTDEGLPQNTVRSILQTRDGFLWLATDGGVARFDGVQFTVFNRRNTPQIHSNEIHSLDQDTRGVLWISTANGLTYFDGTKWSVLTVQDGLPSNDISSVYEDRQGVIWIVTSNGLAKFTQGKIQTIRGTENSVESVLFVTNDDRKGIWIVADSGIEEFADGHLTSIYKGEVSGVTRSPQGVVWVVTDSGMEEIRQGRLELLHTALPFTNSEVTTLFADKEGRIWVGTTSGIDVLSNHSIRSYTERDGLPSHSIHKFYEDHEGSIWVSTDRGMARIADEKINPFTTREGLSAPLVLSVFEDQEGSLWLGTDAGGLTMLRNQKFTTYTATDGLADDNVKAVMEDRQHSIWMGTNSGGVSRWQNEKFSTYNTKNGLASNVVLALSAGAKGGLWVGTPDGLDHLQEGRISHVTSADGLADDYVRSLLASADGSLWIGTSHGISRLKNGVVENPAQLEALSNEVIGAMAEDKAGNLWIGTNHGLREWNQHELTHDDLGMESDPGAERSGSSVTAVYVDGDNQVWLGVKGDGLRRVQQGSVRNYKSILALPHNIYGLAADNSGSLWMSSDRGIFRADMAALNSYADGTSSSVSVQSYGTVDGMPTSQCSSGGHPSVWKSMDGRLWFATPRGMTAIQPETASYNHVPPPVALEEVSVDDEAVPLHTLLKVAPGHTRYTFRYAGLSFIAPQRVRFRYRLEGVDGRWIDAGTRREADYTNLKPGRYRFQVIAENNDHVWNQTGASFYFQVQPHLYQTGGFYIFVGAMLALLSYELYRFRMRQVEAQFQAVLGERNRIAREIHDTLAQGFVGISLQLEIAKRVLAGSNQAVKEHLESAIALVVESLADARRSIWDLRTEPNEAKEFPSKLVEQINSLRKQSTAEIHVDIHGAYRPIAAEIESELVKIAQEAVLNAIRHAEATHIHVEVTYERLRVRVVITDNGRGFPEGVSLDSELPGHYGRKGMQERALLIHAELQLQSQKDVGTAITVTVDA